MVDRTETLLHTVSRTYPMVYGNNLHFPFTTCHCLVPTIRKDCYDSLCSQSAFLLRLGKVTFSSSADFCGPWDGLQIRIIKLFNDVYFLSWKRGQSTSLSLWVPYRFCFFFFLLSLLHPYPLEHSLIHSLATVFLFHFADMFWILEDKSANICTLPFQSIFCTQDTQEIVPVSLKGQPCIWMVLL